MSIIQHAGTLVHVHRACLGSCAQVIAALTAAGTPNTIEAPDILSGTPLLMLNTDLYGAYESQQNVSAANGPEPAAG